MGAPGGVSVFSFLVLSELSAELNIRNFQPGAPGDAGFEFQEILSENLSH